MYVYQVVNLDREELFFGRTSEHLDKELMRLAKDPNGPAAEWSKGDAVHWRPLTDVLEPSVAETLHKEFESRTPPNKFRVIKTASEE